jgi:hypothetical protein
MWKFIKNLLLFLVVALFIFFIIFEPRQAGEFVQNIFEGIATVVRSLGTMFRAVASG